MQLTKAPGERERDIWNSVQSGCSRGTVGEKGGPGGWGERVGMASKFSNVGRGNHAKGKRMLDSLHQKGESQKNKKQKKMGSSVHKKGGRKCKKKEDRT